MIEYIFFIFACLWAFFFIKLKQNFSKKTNFILTIFVILVEILFFIGKKYLSSKNQLSNKVIKIKNFIEYAIIATFTIYIINKFY